MIRRGGDVRGGKMRWQREQRRANAGIETRRIQGSEDGNEEEDGTECNVCVRDLKRTWESTRAV